MYFRKYLRTSDAYAFHTSILKTVAQIPNKVFPNFHLTREFYALFTINSWPTAVPRENT